MANEELIEYVNYLIDEEMWDELAEIQQQMNYHSKYSKAFYFKPYPFQTEMFDAGAHTMARFACLANRVGKTYSGAMEMSYHLTGLYPTKETHGWDWNGYRFDRPIKAWAIGITTDSTRKVMQYELMGTIDSRDTDNIGTGSIPLDLMDIKNMERDGAQIKVVRIKHVSGEESTLEFRSTQQGPSTLMGTAQDYIWLDEESPHNAMEIFSQCTTRLATTNGRLLITATPENGLSSLIKKFYDTPELFIFHAGWDDCPHLSEEVKKSLLATYPEWERDMRTKGIPSKGSGAIFQVEDSEISFPRIEPQANWPILAGVDFGISVDPSTIVFATRDPESKTVYIYDEIYLDKDRSPEAIAKAIQATKTPNIPVIMPHDGNTTARVGSEETRGSILRKLGINVIRDTFSNPPEVQNTIANINKKRGGKEGGLAWMGYMMKHGELKVCNHLNHFFREKRSYFYELKGGKFMAKDGDDHIMDAARVAVLSIGRYGSDVQNCNSGYGFGNNGFGNSSMSTENWLYSDETCNNY